jgi:hypothetical protein
MPLLPLLWLGDPGPPEPSHRAALQQWSSRRGLELAELDAPGPAQRHDATVAEEIEGLLGEARQVHSAVSRGGQVFDRIDALLRAHPELPQAGWLHAERLALEARALAAGDRDGTPGSEEPANAEELSARARAVSESRARTLEQPALDSRAEPPPSLELAVRLRPSDSLLIDARPWSPGSQWTAGLHHLMIYRQGVRVAARFAQLDASHAGPVVDPTAPCSGLDLLGVHGDGARPTAPAGVLCPDWVVARPGQAGGVLLSRCHRDECQPWQLQQPAVAPGERARLSPNPIDDGPAPGRAWITWVAIGAGAVLATGVVLWRAGAFDSGERRTEYVFTGPTAAARWSF